MVSKRGVQFEKATPFHIISRAIEGKKIFEKEGDRCRFIFQMYVANIGSPAYNLHRQDVKKAAYAILNGEKIPSKFIINQHPPLVNNLSFALVVNHHHFFLLQNIEKGIARYLQKVHGGFAKYFNLKHNRKDILFERQYGIVPIETNFQLDAVIRYINVKNPLDVYQPKWRKEGLKNKKKAFEFLGKYQFSSFPDIAGKRDSQIIATSLLNEYCGEKFRGTQGEFVNFIKDYLEEDLVSYYPLYLEEGK